MIAIKLKKLNSSLFFDTELFIKSYQFWKALKIGNLSLKKIIWQFVLIPNAKEVNISVKIHASLKVVWQKTTESTKQCKWAKKKHKMH